MKTQALGWLAGIIVFGMPMARAEDYKLESALAPTAFRGEARQVGLVVRQTLRTEERNAAQPADIVLRMRNYEELTGRIERGEVLSLQEMQDRYLPTRETWQNVARWARGRGLSVAAEDSTCLTVATLGTVAQVEAALQTRFARVIGTDGAEYTSAIEAPTLPTEYRDQIVNVQNLQAHLRLLSQQSTAIPQLDGFILPQTFATLYNAVNLGYDGRGQSIVVLGGAQVNPVDLTTFWRNCGLPTTLAQYSPVVVVAGGASVSDNSMASEPTMDIEWASAMAPGAEIIYLTSVDMGTVTPWITNQIALGRPIRQLSSSYGLPEAIWTVSAAAREATNQYYATLSALGVSIFIASGDEGSTQLFANGTYVRRGYHPSGTTAPQYPASSPFVTGVGGTSVGFQYGGGGGMPVAMPPAREAAWSLSNMPGISLEGQPASGGGVSLYFSRPAWQTGPGLPAGSMRCVPDVAAFAASSFPAYFEFRGQKRGASGTSVAAPIWAGLCALVNQARAGKGMGPLGLLGPKVYPLSGTAGFNQMIYGSQNGTDGYSATATNGAYMVGPYYNLIAGLGSPNVGNLITALTQTEPGVAPVIMVQPRNQAVTAGRETVLNASATGNPLPGYRWQVSADKGATWSDLSDSATYAGTNTSMLTIKGAATGLNGNQYRNTAANSAGTVNSQAVVLTVNTDFFPYPSCIALDGSGNLYVGDEATDTIQKISTAGVVTVVAGTSGMVGADDGMGVAARFNNPGGLAASATGVLTVADTANGLIRRISATGEVTTLAGSATSRGNVDGPGASATFSMPAGIALEGNGRIWIADATNHTIRLIETNGTVGTPVGGKGVAGADNGTGTAARFNHPWGVGLDSLGNLHVSDSGNNVLRKVTSSLVVTTPAGLTGVSGSADGFGSYANFNNPSGLAVANSAVVYVADTGNSIIRKIISGSIVSTLAGLNGVAGLKDGQGSEAWFNQPRALAVDASGNLYVADSGNAAIRKITPDGLVTTLTLSSSPANPGSGGGSSGGGSGGGGTGTTPPPSPSTGGGGGGGGAPGLWFLGLLAALTGLRKLIPCLSQNR